MNLTAHIKWIVGTLLTIAALTGSVFAGWDNLTDRIAVAESKAEEAERRFEEIREEQKSTNEKLDWIQKYLLEKTAE